MDKTQLFKTSHVLLTVSLWWTLTSPSFAADTAAPSDLTNKIPVQAAEPATTCTTAETNAWNIDNGFKINKFVVYPPQAKQASHEGVAVVNMSINTDGSLRRASIGTSSGFPELDTAALVAIKLSRFSPLICSGRERAHNTSQTITFKLDRSPPQATVAPLPATTRPIAQETRELARAMGAIAPRQAMADSERASLAASITQIFPDLSPGTLVQAIDDIEKSAAESIHMKGGWNDQVALYFQSKFSQEEIKELLQFFANPANKNMLSKLASTMETVKAMGVEWRSKTFMPIQEKIMRRLRADNPPKNVREETLGLNSTK